MNLRSRLAAGVVAGVVALAGASAGAVTFRVANQGDANSMDPHTLNESYQPSFFQKILSRNTSFYMLGWTPASTTRTTRCPS